MNEENKNKQKEYIRRQKERGVRDEKIKQALLGVGWKKEHVEICFSELDAESKPVNISVSPSVESEKTSDGSSTGSGSDPDDKDSLEDKSVFNSVALSLNRKRGNLVRVALSVLVIFVILSAASVAAFYVFQGNATGDKKGGITKETSKEERIVMAVVSYLEAESINGVTEIKASIGDFFEFQLLTNSSFWRGEGLNNTLMSLDFDGRAKIKEGGVTLELDAQGETRLVDGVLYAVLNKTPELPFLGDLSFIESEWVRFEPTETLTENDLEKMFGLRKNGRSIEEVVSVINRFGVEILEIAQTEGFMEMEISETRRSYEYKIKHYPENFPNFLRKTADKLPLGDHKEDLVNIAGEAEEEWEGLKREYGIDEEFFFIVSISIEKETNNPLEILVEIKNLVINLDGETEQVSFFFKSSFSDINKTFTVFPPDRSRPFGEVLGEMFKRTLGDLESVEPLQEFDEEELLIAEAQESMFLFGHFRNLLRAGVFWFGSE